MGKVIGIDFGTRHIGLSLSDEIKLMAQPIPALRSEKHRTIAETVAKFISNHPEIDHIVIGNPLGLQGKPTKLSKLVAQFAQDLHNLTHIEYTLWNETNTSAEAEAFGGNIHSQAATIILQAYLDYKRSGI